MAADVFVQGLAAHGVYYFFGTPGSDFPPITEAFARAQEFGTPAPPAGDRAP